MNTENVPLTARMGRQLAALSAWVDAGAANTTRPPEAQLWGRVAKVCEESGEAIAALIGVMGQNPRKGITHTVGDLRGELLDVAVSALAAVEHLDANTGRSLDHLASHLEHLSQRAGLTPIADSPALGAAA